MIKLLSCLVIFPLLGYSQQKDVKIHVQLNGVPDNTTFYLYRAVNLDSAVSRNGQFVLTYHKISPEPEPLAINTGYKEPGMICWVENEDVSIECNYPDFFDTKSSGSATQKEFEGLIKTIKPQQLKIKELRKIIRNEKDPAVKTLAQHQFDSVQSIYKANIENFISANPKSAVSTFILMVTSNDTFTKDEVMTLYSKLDKAQQESETGKTVISTLEMLEKLKSQYNNSKPGN